MRRPILVAFYFEQQFFRLCIYKLHFFAADEFIIDLSLFQHMWVTHATATRSNLLDCWHRYINTTASVITAAGCVTFLNFRQLISHAIQTDCQIMKILMELQEFFNKFSSTSYMRIHPFECGMLI